MCALLYLPDGTLEHETAAAAGALPPKQRAQLRDAVRAAADCESTGEWAVRIVALGKLEAHMVRMEGPLGHRVLVTLSSHGSKENDGLGTLSPRQREVARYAAVGATATETAVQLGISGHTVRQHLKVVYRALGVSNRVELARALDGG
jgi:DNA-binding CsgD family transcriptional regulator